MFKKIFFSVLSTVCLLIVTITVAYAWYITKVADDFKSPLITGKSTAAYYAGGDGSKAKPYKIANERHLYNLAWLQYLGTYNKDYDEDGVVDQYYFEVINDIDCNDLVLPPIGTIDNPFLGNFDGNGYVIKNLSITNDYDNLVKKPSSINEESKFKGVEIIGFFGVIGKYAGFVDANISSEVNSAYDFNLDDLIIQNSCSNTLAGLVAGFVNANVSNVGVHYGKIELKDGTKNISTFDNISGYTLIGDYDSELVSWEDKPSSENGSGDSVDFGGSLNFLEMVTRMGYMTNNNWTLPSVTYNPDKDNSSYPNKENYLSLVVDNNIDNDYYSKNTVENIPANNIGVLTGADTKIIAKATAANVLASDMYILDSSGNKTHPQKLTYLNSGSTSDTSYTYSTQIVDADIYTKDFTTGNTKPSDSLVTNLDENIREDIINILCDDSQMLYGARFNGQIESNNWIEIQDIYIAGAKRNITVPPKAIWFAAQQTGYAKIIFGAYNSSTQGIGVYRIERTTTDGTVENQFFTALSNRKATTSGNAAALGGAQNVNITHIDSAYVNTMSDGSISFTYNAADSSATSSECVWMYTGYRDNVTTDRLYYVEFPIIEGYEYAFGDTNSGGGMILYMDIGQNGAGDGVPSVNPELKDSAIEGVDFVYLNSSNSTFSSTVDDYSAVFFQISGTVNGLTEFYFRRNNDDEDNYAGGEGIVLYFAKNENESEWTTTSSGKTDGSTSLDWSYAGTKGEAGDSGGYTAEDCEVLADSKSSGGLANTNTGTSTTLTITYNYINENYEVVYITKGKVTKGYAINTPTFEIDGYNIVGWYFDEALTTEYDFSSAIDENIVLYAKTKVIQTYVVTFYDGDSVLGTDIVNEGSYASTTAPTKSSYVFSHWTDKDGNTIDLTSYSITADISLYAVWVEGYDITFAYNIGSDDVIIDVIQIENGSLVLEPSDPELKGYNFAGWYTDKTYSIEFDFATAPTASVTIYAKFEAISYYLVTYGYVDNEDFITIMVDSVEENTTPEKPTDPTRSGYVFSGWYTDTNYETEYDFTSVITEDIIIYAYWQQGLTVTYQFEDGTVIDTASVLSGNTITATDISPTMSGYRFDGSWYELVDGVVSDSAFDFTTAITSDLVLVPGWIKTYTITYELNNGEELTSEVVDENGVITAADPTRDGYEFAGWYTDEALTTEYDEDTSVTSDMTLYAKWSVNLTLTPITNDTTITFDSVEAGEYSDSFLANEYILATLLTDGKKIKIVEKSVTYDDITYSKYLYFSGGGSTTACNISFEVIDKATITIYFNSSSSDRYLELTDGTTSWVGTTQTEISTMVAEVDSAQTLYLFSQGSGINVYRIDVDYAEKYTITYDTNGGSEIESQTEYENTTITLPTPTNGNATFAGWSYGDVLYAAGEDITVTSDITLYATWTYASSVVFDANGGTIGENETVVVTLTAGLVTSLPEDPTREDYIFTGWYLDAEGTIKLDTSKPITVDTIYAGWEEDNIVYYSLSYSLVYYDVNGNQVSRVDNLTMQVRSIATNESQIIPEATLIGYEFAGWYTDWDGTTPLTYPHEFNSSYNWLCGKFVQREYTVSFETNGGSSIDSQEIIEGETIIIPDNPTKLGYEFSGWYTDQALNNEFVESSPITGDTTLYAKWNYVGTAIVTYVLNGGTGIESEEVTIGSVIINEPTKAGFNFAGWYIDESLTNEFVSVVESNMTLYAKWEEFEGFVITFNVDGGTEITSQQIANGQLVAKPAQPTKDGYKFAGWYIDSSFAKAFNFEQPVSSDMTIYAKWIVPSNYDFVIDLYIENTSTGVQEYSITLTYNIGETFFADSSALMDFLNIPNSYSYNRLRILNAEDEDLDAWLYNSQVQNWWWFSQLVIKIDPIS